MSSPSFIEFGQPPFPRSDTLSQSGPLKLNSLLQTNNLHVYLLKLCIMKFRLKCNILENPSHSFVCVVKTHSQCLVSKDVQREIFP